MTGKAMEAAARAVLHRRTKPDFIEKRDGVWVVDQDLELAQAAITAYLFEPDEERVERMGSAALNAESDAHSAEMSYTELKRCIGRGVLKALAD